MNRDKNRDLMRGILPSCARVYARHKGRDIARRRRRACREALGNVGPESEWCEGDAFARLGKREANTRSQEVWRVRSRREADKLGSLKRWTKYQSRTSENDEEAYEKICQVFRPGQNLITRHAVGHAEAWLELERDQWRYSYRSRYRQKPPVIGAKEMKRIVTGLFECAHRKLNKALKSADPEWSRRTCGEGSPCVYTKTWTHELHEIWCAENKRWMSYDPSYHYNKFAPTRVRRVTTETVHHIAWKCKNRVLMRCREDLELVVNFLGAWGGDLKGIQPRDYAMREVLVLAKKMDLLSDRALQTMEAE